LNQQQALVPHETNQIEPALPRQTCRIDGMSCVTPFPKMAEFDLAEEPVGVE
jgi:hypothetical protein